MKKSLLLSSALILFSFPTLAIDTLRLEQAIQIGLDNNFSIKISEGQRQIASNDNTLGNARFLPTMDLRGSKGFTWENTALRFLDNREQKVDGAKSTNLFASAEINWFFFDGTTMFHTKNRLEEEEKAAYALNESVIQNIVAQIGKEFYTVALEQIRLEILGENVGFSEARLDIARNKYEVGKASKMEYLQAQVDLNNDKSNYIIQQERLASSKTTLNELLARDVTIDFFVVFDPELNMDLNYEDLKFAMDRGNPALTASRYQVNATKLVPKQIQGERLPLLGLNTSYNYALSEAEAGFLLSRMSSGINYGVTAAWRLYDGNNILRRIQNAKIQAENVEFSYDALQINLDRELYAIFIRYQNNIQLHALEESNREVATENNEIAMERYRVGNATPLELREAQINLLQANLRFLNAAYNLKTGEIDLLLLAGLLIRQ